MLKLYACEIVLDVVVSVTVTGAGFPVARLMELEGWNWQLAPVGRPEQDNVTVPANEPKPEMDEDTGGVVLPGITLTLVGEGWLRLKSTICRVSEKSTMTAFGSEPTACRSKT